MSLSTISWRSVLLMEETGKNHRPAASHWQTLSHIVHSVWAVFKFLTLVLIGTDCIGSYKSNYHTIMTMTAPLNQSSIPVILYVQSFITSTTNLSKNTITPSPTLTIKQNPSPILTIKQNPSNQVWLYIQWNLSKPNPE